MLWLIWGKQSIKTPKVLINIEIIFFLFKLTEKNIVPRRSVKIGVNEFNIPTKELSRSCCARANKKAGNVFPKRLTKKRGKIISFF